MVGELVGQIVGNALQLIANQFESQNKELKAEIRGVRKTAIRAEKKIDDSIDIVAEFNRRLAKMRTRAI